MNRDNNTDERLDTLKWYSLVESTRLSNIKLDYPQLKKIAKEYIHDADSLYKKSDDSINLQLELVNKCLKKETTKLTYETIRIILNKLNEFEKSNSFLKPNITLSNLASKLNTNSKYLSKTINLKKQKTFTKYINDLSLEYFMIQASIDSRLINYTIKAIAEEIGFNTANAFSKAFHKKTGKYPSEYIKELEN